LSKVEILVIENRHMDELMTDSFQNLSPSKKIIFVLKSQKSFGGPQSSSELKKILGMKRKNLDSVLSRMAQKGSIVRISIGIYKYPGDVREPKI
jgi:hypothetical protein